VKRLRSQDQAEVDEAEARGTVHAAIHGLGHLSRRLFQLHARVWQEIVDDELTGPQFTVLGVLHLEGEMDQRTLGAHARLDKSTAAPIVERLRQRGLLEVERDSVDKRRKVLRITPEGRALVVRTSPLAVEVGDRMLAPLLPEEQELLLSFLERMTR
jgi:DNA-binding MarR family transcriptional regulator